MTTVIPLPFEDLTKVDNAAKIGSMTNTNTSLSTTPVREMLTKLVNMLEATAGVMDGNTPEDLRKAILTAKREAWVALTDLDSQKVMK